MRFQACIPGDATAIRDFANLLFNASAMMEAGSVPFVLRGALLIGVPPGDLSTAFNFT